MKNGKAVTLCMGKINIILEIPVLKEAFEIQIPTCVQIERLLPLLARAAAGMSGDLYQSSGQEFLCSPMHGSILADDKTLEAYHIRNGDHLMLI